MSRTELVSESAPGVKNWIEWDDDPGLGARFAMKEQVQIEIVASPDGTVVQRVKGSNEDRQRLALWGEIITGWSWAERGIPVPSQNPAGTGIIASGSTLSPKDYRVFAEATQDVFEELAANPTRTSRPEGSSPS